MITDVQQLILEKPVASVAYFVEFNFRSATSRVCNSNMLYNWNGYDWLALGSMGSISAVEETASATSSAIIFGLNISQVSVLSLAIGTVEEYRGRTAKIYFCPLDDQFRLVGTPQICWRGLMDTMNVTVDGEGGQISLKCETSAYGLKRRNVLRLNAAQHTQRYPSDTGLNQLNNLIANPVSWLSKKFQAI